MGIRKSKVLKIIWISKIRYIIFAFFIMTGVILKTVNSYGYSDAGLYDEKLEFDKDGNLVMTTHDKKATSNVVYKTVGWIIKRYDMPYNAQGQQYAILSAGEDVKYEDDPVNTNYMYCCYTKKREIIEKVIDDVSVEWKNQLFKYGDYVYIDEIMTVIDNGKYCGGFNSDGKSFWGEIYFEYEGISEARPWASKESLRTHFNKKVYFPTQVKTKFFKRTETTIGKISNEKGTECELKIGEGSRFGSSYDVEFAVPTGNTLYVDGKADNNYYNMSFEKHLITFDIPIKFVVSYTLKWKDYSGTVKSEKKEIIQWYYVHRNATYYMIDDCKLYYLTGAHLTNYAFEKGEVDIAVNGLTPKVIQVHMNDYDYHTEFPEYNDVYYLDGGTISQMSVNGVKPSIPDVNRQALANSKVGKIKVRNDYLEIDGVHFLNNSWSVETANQPYTGKLDKKTEVYSTGYLIPHSKQNLQNMSTSGYYTYKEFGSSAVRRIVVKNIGSVSIHTPVCIDAGISVSDIENRDKEELPDTIDSKEIKCIIRNKGFKVIPITNGTHISAKGYMTRDYNSNIEKIEIKTDCDIEVKESETGKIRNVASGEWFEWKKDDVYTTDTLGNKIKIDIRAYAKNYKSVNITADSVLKYSEEKANINSLNYVAFNCIECVVKDEKTEPAKEYRVVGTH